MGTKVYQSSAQVCANIQPIDKATKLTIEMITNQTVDNEELDVMIFLIKYLPDPKC